MKRPQWIRRTWARWAAGRAARRAPIRQPWTALGEGGDQARAGALLRRAIVRQPFSDTQFAAVRARLRRDRAPAARWTRTAQVAAGLAVTLVATLAAGGLLGAARRFWSRPTPQTQPRALPASASPVRRPTSGREPQRPFTPPAEQPAPVAPAPAQRLPAAAASGQPAAGILEATRAPSLSPSPSPPRSRTTVSAQAAKSPPPHSLAAAAVVAAIDEPGSSAGSPAVAAGAGSPPAASRLAEESRLLALALRELRQDNDPAAALRMLDEHVARFGQGGALTPEADTARIEALLRLGRHAEALARLDGMPLMPAGRTRALLAARAELRAEQGRGSAACADFDHLLERAGEHDAIVERALHGRAGCRAQTGDVAGARADLETYLARFPEGRFAADARAALDR